MEKNLFFIGFMGSGKTTISAAFSKRFSRNLIEADDIIVERAGMSVKDIFATQGEEAFRDMETQLCRELVELNDYVVSCGGGMPVRPQNVEYMKKNGFVVLLEARPETILDRVKGSDERPILNGHMNVDYIAELQQKRANAYRSAADIVVQTDGKSVDEIVEEVYESIRRARQSSI
ncbi:MAG: shikimate kinase [Lachnospiraceae bacterium]|nr:shikimate kinase [Lachnospiraceae bacterium]